MTRSKYDPERTPGLVYRSALLGLTEKEIAGVLGISPSSFESWKKKHPEMREQLEIAKAEPDGRVVAALYRAAIGYEVTETRETRKGDVVALTRFIPPDVRAATLWLTNRRRGQWTSPNAITRGGSGTTNVNIKISAPETNSLVAEVIGSRVEEEKPVLIGEVQKEEDDAPSA